MNLLIRFLLVALALFAILESLSAARLPQRPQVDGTSIVYQRLRKTQRNRSRSAHIIREIFRTGCRPPSMALTSSRHIERLLRIDALCGTERVQHTVVRHRTTTARPDVVRTTRPAFIIPANPYNNTNPDYTNLLDDKPAADQWTTSGPPTTTTSTTTSTTARPATSTSTSTTTTSTTTTSTTTTSTTTEAPVPSTTTTTTTSTQAPEAEQEAVTERGVEDPSVDPLDPIDEYDDGVTNGPETGDYPTDYNYPSSGDYEDEAEDEYAKPDKPNEPLVN